MTTRLDRRVSVPGDQASVFAYLADFTNTVEWDPGTTKARRLDEGPLGVGSRFHVTAEFSGREIPLEYEVTIYEPPHRIVIVGSSKRFTSTDDLRVSDVGEGRVRIDYLAIFELNGLLRFAEPFLRSRFHRLADEAVAGIEKALTDRSAL